MTSSHSPCVVPVGDFKIFACDPGAEALLITHKVEQAKWECEGLLILESQRDSVPQPRVARTALPWVTIGLASQRHCPWWVPNENVS